jgi:hypothetical protein
MPVNPFSNKKLLKELQDQRDLLFAKQQQEEEARQQKEEQLQYQQWLLQEAQRRKEEQLRDQQRQLQEAQRWKEQQLQDQQRQLQDQLTRAERQLEQERQVREREHKAREQERQNLARQRDKERRDRERQEKEREQKERERKEREQRRLERLKQTSPEALRGLRDLIRTRYALDMEIWSLKGARKPNRPAVEEKMRKADAVLEDINNMVDTWEENDKVWTPQEWGLARDVKKRILEKGKRQWKDNPPWNEN